MHFWNFLSKRKNYPFFLDAVLDVAYPDCRGQLPVSVVRFSGSDAIIHTDHIFLNNRHLIAFDQKPVLTLRMLLPEGNIEENIHIRWYKWSTDYMVFEIFIEFERSIKQEKKMITKALKRIEKEKRRNHVPAF
jgi:hypothetical protein